MQLILATIFFIAGVTSCQLFKNNPELQGDVQQLEQDAVKGVMDALKVPKPAAPTAVKAQ